MLLMFSFASGAGAVAVAQTPRAAIATEPAAAIIEAFRTHDIVALGDAHGNVQSQEFVRRLVQHPGFADVVDDIVVEFGNARYQPLMDRYIRGDDIPFDSVRLAWRNTTIANEIPVDEEFFRTVRRVNTTRDSRRQLRVLLGDPPIDWAQVRTRADYLKPFSMRISYPAALIQVEVLARQRRALVLYGQLHYQRQNLMSNLDMTDWRMQTLVSALARMTPARIFIVWNASDELLKAEPAVASWKTPSLAVIRGTTIGALDASTFIPTRGRFVFRGEQTVEIPRSEWRTIRAEDELDAVLYLGPQAAMRELPISKDVCRDRAYVEERLRRIQLVGLPPLEMQRVKDLCGIPDS
jgi:hypothetical protein